MLAYPVSNCSVRCLSQPPPTQHLFKAVASLLLDLTVTLHQPTPFHLPHIRRSAPTTTVSHLLHPHIHPPHNDSNIPDGKPRTNYDLQAQASDFMNYFPYPSLFCSYRFSFLLLSAVQLSPPLSLTGGRGQHT